MTSTKFRVYNIETQTVVESIDVSFHENKVNGIGNEEDHKMLIFENEDPDSDESVNSDSFANTDEPTNSCRTEDSSQSSSKDTTFEGEKLIESMPRPESNSLSETYQSLHYQDLVTL